ncbi:MAG: PQQ-dependent sugar dehydrogenase [Bacteroidota bacterium]
MRVLLPALAILLSACGSDAPDGLALASPATEASAAEAVGVTVEEVATGLDGPWGLAFLPDGRVLVTERTGQLRVVTLDGDVSAPLAGVPEVHVERQGGLLDVALDPAFEANRLVYLAFSRPGPRGTSATAVGRGRLGEGALEDVEILFTQEGYHGRGFHFGSRIVFGPEGHLFASTGDRFLFGPAQDLSDHLGVIVRLNPDGSVPEDNPFVGQAGAQPEIWSYGHRNVQSLAFDPATGVLWEAEYGPKGGDELNRIEAGVNYGWPEVSWGDNYDNTPIPDPPTRPEFTDAVVQWTPVISPSGMAFYTGDVFPSWSGDLLISSLSQQGIVRVEIDGEAVTGQEVIELGRRIRDLEEGPDGHVYVLTDGGSGALWRLSPEAGE